MENDIVLIVDSGEDGFIMKMDVLNLFDYIPTVGVDLQQMWMGQQ